ncbi:MAG: dehydratase [Elusimicrobia bacterium]|nr:dehydratase [Elusimicrobiota bacterium]
MRWTRSFTEADIRAFAELSKDKGAHHVEGDARGRLMAHGLLTATLPTKLGGDLGYVARAMRFAFLKAVYSGDTLDCVGVVSAVKPGRAFTRVSFTFHVTNQDGARVLEGDTSGYIPRGKA